MNQEKERKWLTRQYELVAAGVRGDCLVLTFQHLPTKTEETIHVRRRVWEESLAIYWERSLGWILPLPSGREPGDECVDRGTDA